MKIMIVDDSIVYRNAISQALVKVPGIQVVKTVSNGKIAVDYLKLNPHIELVILDMEMPVLDGMESIKSIRKFNRDVAIIVFSSFTTRSAERTINALSLGADDFVAKIVGTGSIEGAIDMIQAELIPKIDAFKSRRFSLKHNQNNAYKEKNKAHINIESIVRGMYIKPKLICIGCSTGGPDALSTIFKTISENISVPMLLVQHMPPIFTKKLAEMLSKLSPVEVKEAKYGDKLTPGVCYIAPGDYHTEINSSEEIILHQNKKVCFVRPSVDVLFESIAKNYNKQVLSVILTGMGDDGANGSIELKKKMAYQFIQDEESSVVWGMPGAVQKIGVEPTVVKLEGFGKLFNLVSRRV